MSGTIYRHYTKAELDRNFDQRGWAGNAEAVLARCAERSRRTAEERRERRAGLRYGPGAAELLDLFPAALADAPVQVFVHGGAWRNFGKDDFLYIAEAFVPAGIHSAILNFSNLPEMRLPDIVAQIRRGIEWVHRNAPSFGGDPGRIHVTANSSGAHLAAMALLEDPAAQGASRSAVKSAALVSGVYNLEPVMLSSRAGYIQLSKEEETALSPLHHAARMPCPVLIACAERDTDEFRLQSREFAAALDDAGRHVRFREFPDLNHFEIMEKIGEARSAVVQAILEHMNAGHEAR